jgi:hypothetical protein
MNPRSVRVFGACALALLLHACAADSPDFTEDLVSVYRSQIEVLNVAHGNFGATPIHFAKAAELVVSAECTAEAEERARGRIACVHLPNGGLGWVLLPALPAESFASSAK